MKYRNLLIIYLFAIRACGAQEAHAEYAAVSDAKKSAKVLNACMVSEQKKHHYGLKKGELNPMVMLLGTCHDPYEAFCYFHFGEPYTQYCEYVVENQLLDVVTRNP